MLDFLFRSGNPSNAWQRSANLTLQVKLETPELNGIALGAQLNRLSTLGRSDKSPDGLLNYFDLGIDLSYASDSTLTGFSVVFQDEDQEFQAYGGELTFHQQPLAQNDLSLDCFPRLFGDCYWQETDDDETLVFYEYASHELQVECTSSGLIKRLVVTRDCLMADPAQRQAYGVDKPWPPPEYSS